jgi:hypothetical protein
MILPQHDCGKKKHCKPVSRILSWAIIYLFRKLPSGINLPTLYLGRAVLKRYYTWHFSMQGLPACDVTIKSCGLLPHIFTLISPKAGQLFSVALSVIPTYITALVEIPGYSPAHCSMLSGLSSPSAKADEAIAWFAANSKFTFICLSIRKKFQLPRSRTADRIGSQRSLLLFGVLIVHVYRPAIFRYLYHE